jgi:putative RNA 2'-phosphotransferase
MNKNLVNKSKFISLILRHKPEEAGITLDENGGWVNVDDLLNGVNSKGLNITREILEEIVFHNTKDRLSFNEDRSKIRANYGHSLPVLLDFDPLCPPEILYHGTATKYVDSIKQQGIISKSRQYVHLSDELETAKLVAIRHGKPIILNILSSKMYDDSYKFYKAANGIWLTKTVPSEYIIFEL